MGFHTLFFLALVSVFSLVAVLFMCVRVCVVRPFGALPRIGNILARHTVVSPWLVGSACSPFHCFPFVRGRPIPFALVLIFFFPCISRRSGPMEEYIWGIYGCGLCLRVCLLTCVAVRRSFLRAVLSLGRPPSQHTWLFHPRMCSGGYDM